MRNVNVIVVIIAIAALGLTAEAANPDTEQVPTEIASFAGTGTLQVGCWEYGPAPHGCDLWIDPQVKPGGQVQSGAVVPATRITLLGDPAVKGLRPDQMRLLDGRTVTMMGVRKDFLNGEASYGVCEELTLFLHPRKSE